MLERQPEGAVPPVPNVVSSVCQRGGVVVDEQVTFHNIPSSPGLKQHADEKLAKLDALIPESETPRRVEVHFNGVTDRKHNVEISLVTKNHKLHTHCSEHDMYKALDGAIEKMVTLFKKEKGKADDRHHKHKTEKTEF
jgi:ribosomal subunit interface protein